MDKQGPTDVLAFPMDELRPGLVNEEPEEGVLGDLVLCPDIAAKQGETAGHGTEAEIELLTVHGILHLLGYDHAEPEEHKEMFGLQDELLAAWRAPSAGERHRRLAAGRRGRCSSCSPASSRPPTPRSASFSRARAEELLDDNRPGARRLVALLEDPPRYLNTALLLRLLCEISAIVLVAFTIDQAYDGAWWPAVLTTIAVMLVISFVAIGVAPRTVGRQHSERVALVSAAPLSFVTAVLGPLPRAADPGRQRAHARARASARARSPRRPSCASWSTSPRPRR